MLKCDICNKGSLYGHNVSHSKRRTAKKFMPNLHKVSLPLDGTIKRLKLCTSCLRTIKRKLEARSMKHETISNVQNPNV